MEKGKLYISKKTNNLIVECIDFQIDSFRGIVINKGDSNFDIGFDCSWNYDCFEEYKKPTSTQIGGNHYKDFKIQPTEFIHANSIPFIEGNIIKYTLRHKHKNGLEDLLKAKHYIDLLISFEYENKESI